MELGSLRHPDSPVEQLYIFGAGGSGREVAWLAEQIFGSNLKLQFLVGDPEYVTEPINGIRVSLVDDVKGDGSGYFVVALGDSSLRQEAVAKCAAIGLQPSTLIHPRVEMSSYVKVGPGSVICAGSILTTNVSIGSHVHVNVNCTLSHDVVVDDYATLSPGVHVSGHVRIGGHVFIGTGANIINGRLGAPLVIGDGAVIAAGACVTKSVAPGALMAGVPAVRKR